MRRTIFVVPVELAPVVQAGCTRAIAVRERRTTEKFLVEGGVTDDPAPWLARVEAAALAALRRRGTALSTDLSAEVPELAERIVLARGKAYEATPERRVPGAAAARRGRDSWCAGARAGAGSPAGNTGGPCWTSGCPAACPSWSRPRRRRRWPGPGCGRSARRR